MHHINAAPQQIIELTILEPGLAPRVERLDAALAPIKIGRLSSSHLRFEHASVSRIHAVIERAADGTLSLIDLGSVAGTTLNGERVTKAKVTHGDVMGFGEVEVRCARLTTSASLEEAPAHERALTPPPLPAQAPAPRSGVLAADGRVVEPYSLQGHYDEAGNYLPGYYDAAGAYHLGYGYQDEQGEWCVASGYYDAAGEWIDTDHPIASVEELHLAQPSTLDTYSERFLGGKGGDVLEVAMVWADQVIAVNTYPSPRSVLLGTERHADFAVQDAALTSELFPLVAHEAQGGYQLVFTAAMSGLIHQTDQTLTFDEAIALGRAVPTSLAPDAYAIRLDARSSARVDIGQMSFLLRFTEQPAALWPMFTIGAAALSVFGFIGLSALLQGSFVALALTSPINAANLELDGFSGNDRFVQAMVLPQQEEEPEAQLERALSEAGEEAAQKHAGEEGKAGDAQSEHTDRKLAVEGDAENERVELRRSIDTEIARNSGALAMMEEVSSPFGVSSRSVGADAIHAIGNLDGEAIGDSLGMGGVGLSDAGRGGGGDGDESIGISDVGTRGKSSGRGGQGGIRYGKDRGDLDGGHDREPQVLPGKPDVGGGLDREIIQRVVRQHRNEIRFCYEKELQKNPKLSGTVKIKFVIAGTGSVMSALVASTDLKSPAVEQCMTGKIQRWTFPEPKGGGIVNVTYPFKFSS